MTFWQKTGTKQKKKYLQIYFDHTGNIQVYSNTNDVRILIQVFI